MQAKENNKKVLKLVQLAILLALVIVLQFWGSGIKIGPTNISTVLIPIAFGAMLLGEWGGAFLGFAFGAIVFICGLTGMDAFTHILIQQHPIITALICLGKSTVAGYVGGLLFRLISKKNTTGATIVATFVTSMVIPILNTGLFILGALLLSDTLKANFVPDGTTVIYFLVIGCAGLNFIVEFLINTIVSPALFSVYRVITKRIGSN